MVVVNIFNCTLHTEEEHPGVSQLHTVHVQCKSAILVLISCYCLMYAALTIVSVLLTTESGVLQCASKCFRNDSNNCRR